ncbi:MAG: lasso RiPP family leader peptide-containing protein [Egibacteraceae bacterium]
MKNESEVYEAPVLVSIGDFAQVTLGRPNWGFEADWSCIMFC